MKIKDAIVQRIQELCEEKSITYNELATRSGVTPSTVYSMMDSRRHDISMITVKKLCDGLDVSVADFFGGQVFCELEQEIG